MNVLGISGVFGHDSAAALIMDNELKYFVEEERIIRDKRAVSRYPLNSSKWCLNKAGIRFDDLDYLAVGWDANLNPKDPQLDEYLKKYLYQMTGSIKESMDIIYVDHHKAHAAYTIASSGFEECGIVIIDGHSEKYSTSIGHFVNGKIDLYDRRDISQSLGYFMESVSDHIGLGRNGAGKLMGLAAYGNPVYDFHPLNILDYDYEVDFPRESFADCRKAGRYIYDQWKRYLNNLLKRNIKSIDVSLMNPKVLHTNPLNPTYRDLAASAQSYLTQAVSKLSEIAIKGLEKRNLVLSGGVALNCATNGEILRMDIADNIHVAPASGDSGTALGAAIVANECWDIKNISNPYTGPSFSDDTIYKVLCDCSVKFSEPRDIHKSVAQLIALDKIVARFSGAMESGPRALGNRSILASGHDGRMRDSVNNTKTRELWRPIASAIIDESYYKYIKENVYSPYMLFALTPTQLFKDKIPASVHIDDTARVQQVNRSSDSTFFSLLEEVDKQIGVPAVLNTSFNNWNEPIVCTPKDALRTFFSSSIDAIQIGSFLIEKR